MKEFKSITEKEDCVTKELIGLFQKYDLSYGEAERIMKQTIGVFMDQKVQSAD